MAIKLLRSLKEINKVLTNGEIKFCLVGGLAVSVRAFERTTKDIDFALAVANEQEAEKIVKYFITSGFKLETLLENKFNHSISTVRLKDFADTSYFIDLIFAASGIEQEVVAQSTEVEVLPDFYLPVATIPGLVVMKLISFDPEIRPTDGVDLNNLISAMSKSDEVKIRELIDLVNKRGYNRGKDLGKSLDLKIEAVRNRS